MDNLIKEIGMSRSLLALTLLIPSIGIGFLLSNVVSPYISVQSSGVAHDALPVAVATATPRSFETVALEAKAAVVYDLLADKVVFNKNSEAQLPLASLTKIMTVYVVADLVKPNKMVTIDKKLFADEAPGLKDGDQWSFKDLLWYTLIHSSNNAAAVAVSAAADASHFQSTTTIRDLMNQKAKELGLVQTYYINNTGLDISDTRAGAYGSARDTAKLIAVAATKHPELFEVTRYDSVALKALPLEDKWAENTDKIVEQIPGVIASKTGYTDLAGGNLAVVFDLGINHPIAIAVLGSSREGRFDDVQKLVNATLRYYQPR